MSISFFFFDKGTVVIIIWDILNRWGNEGVFYDFVFLLRNESLIFLIKILQTNLHDFLSLRSLNNLIVRNDEFVKILIYFWIRLLNKVLLHKCCDVFSDIISDLIHLVFIKSLVHGHPLLDYLLCFSDNNFRLFLVKFFLFFSLNPHKLYLLLKIFFLVLKLLPFLFVVVLEWSTKVANQTNNRSSNKHENDSTKCLDTIFLEYTLGSASVYLNGIFSPKLWFSRCITVWKLLQTQRCCEETSCRCTSHHVK